MCAKLELLSYSTRVTPFPENLTGKSEGEQLDRKTSKWGEKLMLQRSFSDVIRAMQKKFWGGIFWGMESYLLICLRL